MKILITQNIFPDGIELLKNKGFIIIQNEKKLEKKALDKLIKKHNPDIVLSLLTDKLDEKSFCSNLKMISNYAMGFDNIDIEKAKEKNICVTNTPVSSIADCAAEHTVAMILALTTHIVDADDFVRAGKYKGWNPNIFIGQDVRNMTLGLIGSGRIGYKAALSLYKAFGVKVLYTDIQRNEVLEKETEAIFYENVNDIYKKADIISLHVPLTEKTKHMINKETLSLMKKNAILINTARGAVIDENALIDALLKKQIYGAALDVFEYEPKISKKLRKLNNVILTPHIATARVSARRDMSIMAAQNIIEFTEGKVPKGKVC